VIRGHYRTGFPFVPALLILPRLGIAGIIEFLVDTGSDSTVLASQDAVDLGVNLSEDFVGRPIRRSVGIGGEQLEHAEAGEIRLREDDAGWLVLRLVMSVAPAQPANLRVPSLMGQDVLRSFRLTCEASAGVVTLERLTPKVR